MNYKKIYEQLVLHRLANPLPKGVYGEKHHIIPTAEGGKDDASNKVKFTAREHYIAHLLLAKIYDDCAMYDAITFMRTGRHKGRDFKINSILYQKMRELLAKKISLSKKGRHYYNNGKVEVMTFECPEGFVPGRMPYSEEVLKKMKIGSQSEKQKAAARANFQKAAAMNKGKPFTEEHRRRISEAVKGEKNGMYGKTFSEETRKKLSESRLGMKFWNNGKISVRARSCPDGFVAGRLKKKKTEN